MSYEFVLVDVIPASPKSIYDAWLDSRGHSQMTGGKAKMSARPGEIHYGRVPPYSVVVSGTLPGGPDKPSLYCAVIVKKVDARTRAKTSINELLRD